MYVVHLNTGQYYQGSGTVQVDWANPSLKQMQICRSYLWGGISIGANMDFSSVLYLEDPDHFLAQPGASNAPGLMPLNILAFDRYGTSNGQNYDQWCDWREERIVVKPGKRLILQANCVQHDGEGTTDGLNDVFKTNAANDNCHAQAYVYLRPCDD